MNSLETIVMEPDVKQAACPTVTGAAVRLEVLQRERLRCVSAAGGSIGSRRYAPSVRSLVAIPEVFA